MKLDPEALARGAEIEAEWDGRTFFALGRADKQRYVDRLEAAVTAYLSAAPAGWQPIETAPKDGTVVDLWCSAPGAFVSAGPCRVPDCWFYDGQWWTRDELHGDDFNRSEVHNATHWMPLPVSPVPQEPSNG